MKSNSCVVVSFFLGSLLLSPVFSVRMAAQAPTPYRLTLQDAIQKGLAGNLNGQLASARVDEAAGTRMRRASSALLPRVSAQSYANVQNRDLRAFGISFPGLPEVVGPFSNYDFRVYAQQNIFDLQSLHGLKASERTLDADKLDYRDMRDAIVRSVAALYLNAESAAARMDAAQSRRVIWAWTPRCLWKLRMCFGSNPCRTRRLRLWCRPRCGRELTIFPLPGSARA